MKLLVTCRELRYAGKTLFAGDEFEATDKDGKLLVAVKKARLPGEAAVIPAKVTRQSDLPLSQAVVEPAETLPSPPVADPKTKRQYRRRDMIAED